MKHDDHIACDLSRDMVHKLTINDNPTLMEKYLNLFLVWFQPSSQITLMNHLFSNIEKATNRFKPSGTSAITLKIINHFQPSKTTNHLEPTSNISHFLAPQEKCSTSAINHDVNVRNPRSTLGIDHPVAEVAGSTGSATGITSRNGPQGRRCTWLNQPPVTMLNQGLMKKIG